MEVHREAVLKQEEAIRNLPGRLGSLPLSLNEIGLDSLRGAPYARVLDRRPPGRRLRLSLCVITTAHRSKIDLARHGT
jgi:hypothetical protein